MHSKHIDTAMNKISSEVTSLAKDIWENPEGPYEEFFASRRYADILTKYGFDVELGAGGIKTAVKARFGHGHPVIGFLGEYDALPGLSCEVGTEDRPIPGKAYGHACGHNLLAGANIGAVIALKSQMEKDSLPGTIIFYGCPAEEVLTGKPFMARAGLFDELDVALAFHPMECNMATCGNMVATNMVKFHFKGRSAHAGADPQNGRSALDAVQLMNMGTEFLREHLDVKAEEKVHYMITECGSVPNIIPDKATVWYYIRSAKRENVEKVYSRVVDIAKGAALMTGTQVETEFLGGCYSGLNNSVLENTVLKAMNEIPKEPWTAEELEFAAELNSSNEANREKLVRIHNLPKDTQIHDGVLPMLDYGDGSSSDIGDVAHIVPTAFFTTACQNLGAPGHNWQITVCSGSSIGFKGMLFGAKVLANAALDMLVDPLIIKSAKAEFEKKIEGKPYECPLPDYMMPPA